MGANQGLSLEYVMQAVLLIFIVIVFFGGMIIWTKIRKKRRQK
ncbi:hypothetical protein [Paenibacillus albiflavus]|nr:hypothetical protein [Paenibacillus albiflavus]